MLFFKTLLSHRKKQSNRSVWDPQLDALALLPHCWEVGKNCTKIKERGNKHKSHLVRLQGVGLQRVCFPEVHLRKADLSLEPFPPVLSKSHRAPSYSGTSPSQNLSMPANRIQHVICLLTRRPFFPWIFEHDHGIFLNIKEWFTVHLLAYFKLCI